MPKHRPVVCLHCQVEHPEAHHERVVYNKTPLYGPWVDWRMAGKDLTSSEADRISVRRSAAFFGTNDHANGSCGSFHGRHWRP